MEFVWHDCEHQNRYQIDIEIRRDAKTVTKPPSRFANALRRGWF